MKAIILLALLTLTSNLFAESKDFENTLNKLRSSITNFNQVSNQFDRVKDIFSEATWARKEKEISNLHLQQKELLYTGIAELAKMTEKMPKEARARALNDMREEILHTKNVNRKEFQLSPLTYELLDIKVLKPTHFEFVIAVHKGIEEFEYYKNIYQKKFHSQIVKHMSADIQKRLDEVSIPYIKISQDPKITAEEKEMIEKGKKAFEEIYSASKNLGS